MSVDCNALIAPSQVADVTSVILSGLPPLKKGTDKRVGYGFRLGEHADFQILFEMGPQKFTKPLGKQNKYSCVGNPSLKCLSILGGGVQSYDNSDTSKRMVDQSDYSKKQKVSIMNDDLKNKYFKSNHPLFL